MRTTIIIGSLLLSSWWSTSVVMAQRAPAKSSVEAEVRAVMAERTKANRDGDTDKVESLMADEYVQTDIFDRVQNKSEWLAEYFRPLAELIKAGKFHWDIWDEKAVQVRTFGDTAVVVGSVTLKGSGATAMPKRGWVASPGASIGPITLRSTRVYVKRNGKWLIAALHNAMLPQEITPPGVAQSAAAGSPEAELVSLTNAWTDAIVTKDPARLDALMSPDFALYFWGDRVHNVSRALWLENLLQHYRIAEYEHSTIVARVYGDVGVVTSKYYWRGSFREKPFEYHGYVVDVWRRGNGRWQVVSRTSV